MIENIGFSPKNLKIFHSDAAARSAGRQRRAGKPWRKADGVLNRIQQGNNPGCGGYRHKHLRIFILFYLNEYQYIIDKTTKTLLLDVSSQDIGTIECSDSQVLSISFISNKLTNK
jgi:hypothetical protein